MSACADFAEEISGRTLQNDEDTLEDPSAVFNLNEDEDERLAEERAIHTLRMLYCGRVAVWVRPLGGARAHVKEIWAEQVGLATWCGMAAGQAALKGKRVVELGATLGLVGGAAYHERLGDCDECCLTAIGKEVVENLQRDDANNGCEVARLNWHDFGGDDGNDLEGAAQATLADIGPIDVALGANIIGREDGERLARVINHLAGARAGFFAVLLHEAKSRYLVHDFLPEAARLGLSVETTSCADLEEPLINNIEMRGVPWGDYVRLTLRKVAATTPHWHPPLKAPVPRAVPPPEVPPGAVADYESR